MKIWTVRYLVTLFIFCNLCGRLISAEGVPAPAKAQVDAILIQGGTAHLGTGEVIEDALIGFVDGKISFVSSSDRWSVDLDEWKVIDASGKHIYPGLIAPNTRLGLVEVRSLRATHDYDEVGLFNPHVKSIISYNAESMIIPTVRSNGVLLAQVAPYGGRISGTSSIVALDAWNWEDAAYIEEDGIHLRWPSLPIDKGQAEKKETDEANEKYTESMQELIDFFQQAEAYCRKEKHDVTNLRFEAMRAVFDRSRQTYIHTNNARDLMAAINFLNQFGLKGVIVGGRDAWMVPELLVKNKVPVIYLGVHSLPRFTDADIDIGFKIPALLKEAGVDFCFGISKSTRQRNLMFLAGYTVGYGLSKEEALMAISSSTARILGIDDQVGTLEAGKDATLIISKGDILDIRTCEIESAFIQGRAIDLGNKHKELYRKYSEKLF